VIPDINRVVVDGLNLAKKNVRPKRENEKGQVVEYNAPLQASNVMVVCPKCNKPTRLGRQFVNDKKERVCKKCNQVMS
jgi:large subunit ribosomal protein L24